MSKGRIAPRIVNCVKGKLGRRRRFPGWTRLTCSSGGEIYFYTECIKFTKPSRPKTFQQVRNRFRMEEIRLYDSPFKELADQVSKN